MSGLQALQSQRANLRAPLHQHFNTHIYSQHTHTNTERDEVSSSHSSKPEEWTQISVRKQQHNARTQTRRTHDNWACNFLAIVWNLNDVMRREYKPPLDEVMVKHREGEGNDQAIFTQLNNLTVELTTEGRCCGLEDRFPYRASLNSTEIIIYWINASI